MHPTSAAPNNSKPEESGPSTASSSSPPSSWFSSWFGNQSTDVRKQIREKLNAYDEKKKQHEERILQSPLGGMFGGGFPFLFPPGNGFFGGDKDQQLQQHEKEVQDLFERLKEDMMSSSSSSTTSTSRVFTSGSSVSIRQSTRDGAQIDVQLPRGSSIEDVAVNVVQEYPCVVQYRVDTHKNSNKNNGSVGGSGSRHIQNQVRLGDYVDCGKVSASVSTARNLLTVTAPVQEKTSIEEIKPRSVPVTEHDYGQY